MKWINRWHNRTKIMPNPTFGRVCFVYIFIMNLSLTFQTSFFCIFSIFFSGSSPFCEVSIFFIFPILFSLYKTMFSLYKTMFSLYKTMFSISWSSVNNLLYSFRFYSSLFIIHRLKSTIIIILLLFFFFRWFPSIIQINNS
jgi:hypothetical protein